MKKWKQKPANKEVEKLIKEFFRLLQQGNLDQAKNLINHRYDDWDSQIWSIWQDTYLIYLEDLNQEAEDDTFEGNLWKNDLNWLKKIEIEDKFHWDGDNSLFVNIIYENVVTDVSADFSLEQNEAGYILTREIIHIM